LNPVNSVTLILFVGLTLQHVQGSTMVKISKQVSEEIFGGEEKKSA
jgi:hypothetical protein